MRKRLYKNLSQRIDREKKMFVISQKIQTRKDLQVRSNMIVGYADFLCLLVCPRSTTSFILCRRIRQIRWRWSPRRPILRLFTSSRLEENAERHFHQRTYGHHGGVSLCSACFFFVHIIKTPSWFSINFQYSSVFFFLGDISTKIIIF